MPIFPKFHQFSTTRAKGLNLSLGLMAYLYVAVNLQFNTHSLMESPLGMTSNQQDTSK